MSSSDAGATRLMMRALSRPRDLARAAHTLAWLVCAQALLFAGGFKLARRAMRMRTVAEVDRAPGDMPALDAHSARGLQVAQRVLDLRALRVTCVPRSLALERVCVANGVPAELVIGVDRSEGFKAHAWVEVNGYAVGATEVGRAHWTALGRFRSARAERLG